MKAVHIRTLGLSCHECTSQVEKTVSDLDGVVSVTSIHDLGITSVMFDELRVGPETIIDSIQTAGFDVEVVDRTQAAGAQ